MDVLHTDDPDREGNLTAEEYNRRAEARRDEGGPCHRIPDVYLNEADHR